MAKSIPQRIEQILSERKIATSSRQRTVISEHFLGVSAVDPSKFKFRKGDITLILQVAEFIKSKLNSPDAEDVSPFFVNSERCANRNATTKSLVGELFRCSDEAIVIGSLGIDNLDALNYWHSPKSNLSFDSPLRRDVALYLLHFGTFKFYLQRICVKPSIKQITNLMKNVTKIYF